VRLLTDDALAAVTIFQEAEGELYVGKLAVAEVIRNRMAQRYQSDGTVAGTVARPLQFSGWNASAPNRVRSLVADDTDPEVADCIKAWAEAKTGSDVARGATLYFNPRLAQPSWANRVQIVAAIGNHQFFKDPNVAVPGQIA
jgi:N-acetylmuramoyl-L-alanine amidase